MDMSRAIEMVAEDQQISLSESTPRRWLSTSAEPFTCRVTSPPAPPNWRTWGMS